MKELLSNISQVLLLVVLILQAVAIMYLIYTSYKRFQDDKKCWKQRDEAAKEIKELAVSIEEEYRKYLESKSKLDDCDKLADDSKECAEDEKTIEESTTENTDKE